MKRAIIFFTTSLALEVIRNEGFRFYYIPSKALMPADVTSTIWNNMMKRQLQDIINIHGVKGIVFDGAYPYAGVVGALKEFNHLKGIWVKRETYKQGSDNYRAIETLFDTVIVPREAGDKEKNVLEVGNRHYCNPIVSIQQEEAYERDRIRNILGVSDNEKLVYVQLGAGNINEIEDALDKIIEGVLTLSNYRVLLGESIIGKPLNIRRKGVQIIRHYPNSVYFKGVDYAVSAAEYNTFDELLYFNIPTLFIPNIETRKDDRVKRAMWAHEAGVGICLEKVHSICIIY